MLESAADVESVDLLLLNGLADTSSEWVATDVDGTAATGGGAAAGKGSTAGVLLFPFFHEACLTFSPLT